MNADKIDALTLPQAAPMGRVCPQHGLVLVQCGTEERYDDVYIRRAVYVCPACLAYRIDHDPVATHAA